MDNLSVDILECDPVFGTLSSTANLFKDLSSRCFEPDSRCAYEVVYIATGVANGYIMEISLSNAMRPTQKAGVPHPLAAAPP